MLTGRQRAALVLVLLVAVAVGAWLARSSEDDGVPTLGPSAEASDEPAAPDSGSTAVPLARSPVIGRVVDQRTGEPVPALDLTIACQVPTTARTDRDGSFESEHSAPRTSLTISIEDAGGWVTRFEAEHVPRTEPLNVPVPIGPTYPLLVPSGFVAGDWEARVVETRQPRDVAGRLEVLEDDLRMVARGRTGRLDLLKVRGQRGGEPYGTDLSDRRWPWIPVRNGAPPWVRYRRVLFEADDAYERRLELRRIDGSRVARATVTGVIGIHDPVRVDRGEPEPFGVLSGRIDLAGAAPRATVVLLPTPDEATAADRPPYFEELLTWTDGNFTFDRVPIGTRTALVYAANCELVRTEVNVERGRNAFPEVRLARQGQVGFKVKFRNARRPTYQRYCAIVRLVEAGPYARAWYQLDGSSGGLGAIWLHDIPDAQYDFRGVGSNLLPHWEPQRFVLEPGERFLHVVPPEDMASYGFEVTTAYGPPQTEVRVYFGPGGGLDLSKVWDSDRRWSIPSTTPLRWTVWANGHAPVSGTEADFAAAGDERIAKVTLSEGWGAQLYFRAGNPNRMTDSGPWERFNFVNGEIGAWAGPPLEGVRVLAGTLAGKSDSEGFVSLTSPDRPSELELVAPGWRLAGVERISYSPRRDRHLRHRHVVWMERQ
ncbi:MAG: hypothetical protein GY711_03935 [bacterium]|nr:hypothetical protein [bacterium]